MFKDLSTKGQSAKPEIWNKQKFSRKCKNKVKIKHIRRRWGISQNFFLAFIDEFEKQLFIKKTIEVGQ